MDHEQAVQTQASMRYVLSDLTPAERDAFEEHYADCSHCMNDVDLAAIFVANAREVFRKDTVPAAPPKSVGWFQWRPFPVLALSAALNLFLVAGVGYELTRVRQAAPTELAKLAEPGVVDVVPVHGTTRATGGPQVIRATGRTVVLSFDLPQRYDRYLYSVNRAGNAVLSGELQVTGTPDSLNLQIPLNRLSSGEYRVTLTGASGTVREDLGACVLLVGTP
jgi:hypothetical protein